MTKPILIVEDQLDILELVVLNVSMLGYEPVRCMDGDEALRLARAQEFALIILDIMLPGMDGVEICKILRKTDELTPILMLTAKKNEMDRVAGLESGADDYLTKPFSVLELQARVKALLRRAAHTAPEPEVPNNIQLGELTLCQVKRQVHIAGKEVHLTAKEFDLLTFLASSPGKVFTREHLLSAVWGYQYSGYEHTVNSHINRLRSKLEKDPAAPQYVQTVWGVGYKLGTSLENSA